MDMFKQINDEHGREVGDEVLEALVRHLRGFVSGEGGVHRYARDEFLVLLPGIEKERAFLSLEAAR